MLCAVAHKNDILMNRTPGWQMVHAGMGSGVYIIRRCQHGITNMAAQTALGYYFSHSCANFAVFPPRYGLHGLDRHMA